MQNKTQNNFVRKALTPKEFCQKSELSPPLDFQACASMVWTDIIAKRHKLEGS